MSRVKPGDHVILNFRANRGHCHHRAVGRPLLCDGIPTPRHTMFDGTVRLHRDGKDINQMARTTVTPQKVRALAAPQRG